MCACVCVWLLSMFLYAKETLLCVNVVLPSAVVYILFSTLPVLVINETLRLQYLSTSVACFYENFDQIFRCINLLSCTSDPLEVDSGGGDEGTLTAPSPRVRQLNTWRT